MKSEIIFNESYNKQKKSFKIRKYITTFLQHDIWVLDVDTWAYYYDDGYVSLFHGEFTDKEDAFEELAWQLNEHIYS